MESRTRKMIVYFCAALMLIIGLYSFIIIKDSFSGTVWTVFGIIFIILGYFRIRG